jgi:hypothetical protein
VTSNIFTYQGKSDDITVSAAVTRAGTGTTIAGAKSLDQCFPQHFQLDESMGTHLLLGNFADLTAESGVTTATACRTTCSSAASCIAATFVYSSTTVGSGNAGSCYFTAPGASATIDLAVKALPWDTVSGQAVGKAAVTSGSYVIYLGHAEGSMLGKPITTVGATIGNSATGTVHSKADCKDACDGDASCWGFYWQETGTKCYLRTGNEWEGARTFVRVEGTKVDWKSAAAYF